MNESQTLNSTPELAREICGIVMPVAEMSTTYSATHWKDVRRIINKAIEAAGYIPRMVSEAAEVNVIQASIVTNLAENPIVVCDVSGKNANCMFELGLRLAFDKPTIIIKDELTGYSFDTGPVKHLNYRSDLRFQNMMDFMDELTATIKATAEAASKSDYSPFLNTFSKRPKGIPQFEGTALDYVLSQINRISTEMSEVSSRLADVAPTWREGRLKRDRIRVNITDPKLQDHAKAELELIDAELDILQKQLSDPTIFEMQEEKIIRQMQELHIKSEKLKSMRNHF